MERGGRDAAPILNEEMTMTTMELMLLLEAGVEPETLRQVEIASRLARAVRAADRAVRTAVDWKDSNDSEDMDINQRAIKLAIDVGRMF
jgi:hypothetical protein